MGRRLTERERADRATKETDFQASLVNLAHRHHWKVVHFHQAEVQPGVWATPVSADAKGFFDLMLFKAGRRPIYAELKRELESEGKLSDDQLVWLKMLLQSGQIAVVWRPSDREDIATVLAGSALGGPSEAAEAIVDRWLAESAAIVEADQLKREGPLYIGPGMFPWDKPAEQFRHALNEVKKGLDWMAQGVAVIEPLLGVDEAAERRKALQAEAEAKRAKEQAGDEAHRLRLEAEILMDEAESGADRLAAEGMLEQAEAMEVPKGKEWKWRKA